MAFRATCFHSGRTRPAAYLAFLGRISPEKGPNRAIEIAARAGMPLKIAAKVDRVDQAYWDEIIRPMVEAHSKVEFIGEIGERDKAAFLGEAAAFLFPIDWPERHDRGDGVRHANYRIPTRIGP
jgi:glycosyltransferase involved in cell wall biosynthesis